MFTVRNNYFLHTKKYQPVNKLIPLPCYSNSIVPGGLEVISYITLFTPRTSLMILFIVSIQKSDSHLSLSQITY